MKIIIDGEIFTQEKLNQWKRESVIRVLRKFKVYANVSDSTDILCQRLTALKMSLSCSEMREFLKWKLMISEWAMKIASILSGDKRCSALTTIYAEGITAEKLSIEIDKLMLDATTDNREINLSVCPDHYILNPCNGTLEVIETTGNSPLPTQFFITFNDETGLKEPRDSSYTHQSVGVARLKNGTVIGGVRHQFKNTSTGIEARLLVEFPSICPKFLLRAHQKHLAAEWSGWIAWIKTLSTDTRSY